LNVSGISTSGGFAVGSSSASQTLKGSGTINSGNRDVSFANGSSDLGSILQPTTNLTLNVGTGTFDVSALTDGTDPGNIRFTIGSASTKVTLTQGTLNLG